MTLEFFLEATGEGNWESACGDCENQHRNDHPLHTDTGIEKYKEETMVRILFSIMVLYHVPSIKYIQQHFALLKTPSGLLTEN